MYSSNELNINSNSSMISRNGQFGVYTSGSFNSNYSNVTFNSWNGVYLNGNKFSNIKIQYYGEMILLTIAKYIWQTVELRH